ncbi:MAG: dihydroorotate dehydrogenase [Oscillospiraceae bacterium]|jgi:dihydroorotate dehydrogenase (NAD+) catalytic subunit|nr:dihydroorotate dehydrogenase [Oscillospiraceae bacterium]
MVNIVDISARVGSVRLKNPIMSASGTFGFGVEAARLYDINRLGGVVMKGVTVQPRRGNPLPRVTDCPSGMLNAVGLENPGVDRALKDELPALADIYGGPIIANICGFTIDEYAELAARFDGSDLISALEVNVSCPNVSHGGMTFGTDAKAAGDVTRAVRRAAKKPVWVKLSPNVTDVAEIARACEAEGADALTLINTLLGMRIDLRSRRPVLGNTLGGLSGPCVLPVALRMVWQAYEAVKIPIVGMGGISSARDVVEMTLAGASAVQVGTAGLVEPSALVDIADALPGIIAGMGLNGYGALVGAAHG